MIQSEIRNRKQFQEDIAKTLVMLEVDTPRDSANIYACFDQNIAWLNSDWEETSSHPGKNRFLLFPAPCEPRAKWKHQIVDGEIFDALGINANGLFEIACVLDPEEPWNVSASSISAFVLECECYEKILKEEYKRKLLAEENFTKYLTAAEEYVNIYQKYLEDTLEPHFC